jgi:hypothetical protein
MDANAWRVCSTCKQPIAFGTGYYVCNVSTCNRKATDFAFCSVACWDAHVPTFRHRDSWAVEQRAPTRAAWEGERRRAEVEETERAARAAERTQPTPIVQSDDVPVDTLIVASKLKAYIRARSGMNTSDGVLDVLSDRVRALCDAAIDNAAQAGRKTVLDRDF